jgi:hypothetical protein
MSEASLQPPSSSPGVKTPTHAAWAAQAKATEQDANVNTGSLFDGRAIIPSPPINRRARGFISSGPPPFDPVSHHRKTEPGGGHDTTLI